MGRPASHFIRSCGERFTSDGRGTTTPLDLSTSRPLDLSLPRPKRFSSSMFKFQSFVLNFTKARAVHCSRAAPCLAAYHTLSFMVILSLPVRPRIKKPRSSDFFQTMKSGSCRIRTTSHCSTVGLRDQGTTMRLVRSCTTEPGNIGGRSPSASALDLVPGTVFIGHR